TRPALLGQRRPTALAGGREVADDLVDLVGRQPGSGMGRVPELGAALPPGGAFAHRGRRLGRGGGRRAGRGAGGLGEACAQLADLGFQGGKPLLEGGEERVTLAATGARRLGHATILRGSLTASRGCQKSG